MSAWTEWRHAPAMEFAVVGDPIEHSLSPRMFAASGLPGRYGAIRVPLSEFDEALHHLVKMGYEGVNVTLPLKEAAYRWCTQTDALATSIGAVNTLRLQNREGRNTDVIGVQATLASLEFNHLDGALVLGAGGTARAVCVALHALGAPITLWNRTRAKAEALQAELGIPIQVVENLDNFEQHWVINTTSAGHAGVELPMMFDSRRVGTAVDASYGVGGTAWTRTASASGWRVADGRAMLVAQGAASYAWWTGLSPDTAAMREAVEAALAP